MRKQITFTAVFALFIQFVTAQQLYSEAVITKSSGEKLAGFIRNTTYEGTPQSFEYSKEKGGATLLLTAADIVSVVVVDGPVYEKFSIKVPVINKPYINRLKEEYADTANIMQGDLLIEKLVEGKITLYLYTDKYQYEHFFYKEAGDGDLTQMTNESHVNLKEEYQKDDTWRNMVFFLGTKYNCSGKVNTDAESRPYQKLNMIRIFRKLNACAGGESNVINQTGLKKKNIRFGVLAGLARVRMPYLNYTYPEINNSSFREKLSFVPGYHLDFVPSKPVVNYLVSLEGFLHFYSDQSDSLYAPNGRKGVADINISSYQQLVTLSYFLTKKKGVRPSLEAGILAAFVLSAKGKYNYNYLGFNQTVNYLRPDKFSYGFTAGAGVHFSRFSLHLRYWQTINPSQQQDARIRTNSLLLMGKLNLTR